MFKHHLSIFLFAVIAAGNHLHAQDLSILTEEEQEIYENGGISTPRIVFGGLVGSFYGMGLGHLIEGEFLSRGWKFTLSQGVGTTLMVMGLIQAADEDHFSRQMGSLVLAGSLLVVASRVWEIVDLWTHPWERQRDFREVEEKLKESKPVSFYFAPSADSRGEREWQAGFQIQF